MSRLFSAGAVVAAGQLASDDERWYDRAACYGNSKLFDALTPVSVQVIRYVGEVYCADCPVQRECLNDALRYGAVSTVRGGVLFDYHGQIRNMIRPDRRNNGKLIFVSRR